MAGMGENAATLTATRCSVRARESSKRQQLNLHRRQSQICAKTKQPKAKKACSVKSLIKQTEIQTKQSESEEEFLLDGGTLFKI